MADLPLTFRASPLPANFRGYGCVSASVEEQLGHKIDFNNKEDWRFYQNAYRAFDLERSREAERKRYAKNKAAYKLTKKIWKKNNADKVAAIKSARRALEYGQTHPDIDRKAAKRMFEQSKARTIETGIPHCVDHIIPLKRGGWHHHLNLQVLPKSVNCTSQKGVNPFWISRSKKYLDWRSVPRFLWPKDLIDKYLNILDLQQETLVSRELISA